MACVFKCWNPIRMCHYLYGQVDIEPAATLIKQVSIWKVWLVPGVRPGWHGACKNYVGILESRGKAHHKMKQKLNIPLTTMPWRFRLNFLHYRSCDLLISYFIGQSHCCPHNSQQKKCFTLSGKFFVGAPKITQHTTAYGTFSC